MRTKEEKEADRKQVLGAGRPSSEVMATLELCRTIDDAVETLDERLGRIEEAIDDAIIKLMDR